MVGLIHKIFYSVQIQNQHSDIFTIVDTFDRVKKNYTLKELLEYKKMGIKIKGLGNKSDCVAPLCHLNLLKY